MLEETVGVAVFVLRRTPEHQSELLLLERAGGGWEPVTGRLRADEREAEAALRELFQATALEPDRLYAAAFSAAPESASGAGSSSPGRVGVFVAYVAGDADVTRDAEPGGWRWCPLRDAGPLLDRETHRRTATRLLQDFVRQSPDESLRVF